jgi:lipopolysaccharide export system protein LptA
MTLVAMRPNLPSLFASFAFFALAPGAVLAERTDREKPVDLEADKVSVDDVKKTLVFEGNVLLTQGSLTIRASRLVVVQDQAGFQKGTAYGTPAKFRQKREGREDFIEGEAERIEHDARSDRTEFFVKARVKSGGDDVSGNYIQFDGITERYQVTGAISGAPGVAPADTRVRATLQPKKEPAKESAK